MVYKVQATGLALFEIIENCCNEVVVRQEFRKKFLSNVIATEQTLF